LNARKQREEEEGGEVTGGGVEQWRVLSNNHSILIPLLTSTSTSTTFTTFTSRTLPSSPSFSSRLNHAIAIPFYTSLYAS